MVAITYERWSLTRGSKYSDLTWKHLVFEGSRFESSRGGELVA